MVDADKFTIHPEIEGELSLYSITKHKDGVCGIWGKDTLENILCRYLDLPNFIDPRYGWWRFSSNSWRAMEWWVIPWRLHLEVVVYDPTPLQMGC